MTQISMYVEARFWEMANARAKTLKIPRGAVLRAAIERGIRELTTSAIILAERQWRDRFGEFDRCGQLKQARKRRQELLAAKKEKAA